MNAFEWHDEYSVGDAAIDSQHQKIIDILNHLHELLNAETVPDHAAAGKVFDQLAEYVMTHFAYEEQRMSDSGYPVDRIAEHRKQHNALLGKVQQIMDAHENGDNQALAELLPYLYGDWLIDHICHTDQEYAPFLGASR